MKKFLFALLVLYLAILACGLWQATHSKSYYGTPILAGVTVIFSDINQLILSKYFGYSSLYFEVFLYQDRQKYWALMAGLSLVEFAVLIIAAYITMRVLLNLRRRLKR